MTQASIINLVVVSSSGHSSILEMSHPALDREAPRSPEHCSAVLPSHWPHFSGVFADSSLSLALWSCECVRLLGSLLLSISTLTPSGFSSALTHLNDMYMDRSHVAACTSPLNTIAHSTPNSFSNESCPDPVPQHPLPTSPSALPNLPQINKWQHLPFKMLKPDTFNPLPHAPQPIPQQLLLELFPGYIQTQTTFPHLCQPSPVLSPHTLLTDLLVLPSLPPPHPFLTHRHTHQVK